RPATESRTRCRGTGHGIRVPAPSRNRPHSYLPPKADEVRPDNGPDDKPDHGCDDGGNAGLEPQTRPDRRAGCLPRHGLARARRTHAPGQDSEDRHPPDQHVDDDTLDPGHSRTRWISVTGRLPRQALSERLSASRAASRTTSSSRRSRAESSPIASTMRSLSRTPRSSASSPSPCTVTCGGTLSAPFLSITSDASAAPLETRRWRDLIASLD